MPPRIPSGAELMELDKRYSEAIEKRRAIYDSCVEHLRLHGSFDTTPNDSLPEGCSILASPWVPGKKPVEHSGRNIDFAYRLSTRLRGATGLTPNETIARFYNTTHTINVEIKLVDKNNATSDYVGEEYTTTYAAWCMQLAEKGNTGYHNPMGDGVDFWNNRGDKIEDSYCPLYGDWGASPEWTDLQDTLNYIFDNQVADHTLESMKV